MDNKKEEIGPEESQERLQEIMNTNPTNDWMACGYCSITGGRDTDGEIELLYKRYNDHILK